MSLCVEKVAAVEWEYASDVARCEYSRFVIPCIDFFACIEQSQTQALVCDLVRAIL